MSGQLTPDEQRVFRVRGYCSCSPFPRSRRILDVHESTASSAAEIGQAFLTAHGAHPSMRLSTEAQRVG